MPETIIVPVANDGIAGGKRRARVSGGLATETERARRFAMSRWGVRAGYLVLAAGAWALPDRVMLGPHWLYAALVLTFGMVITLTHERIEPHLTHALALFTTGMFTTGIVLAAFLLVIRLPRGIPPLELLREAALVWGMNCFIFAIWYWEIDCGGPKLRHAEQYHSADFLFPQATVRDDRFRNWHPSFVDYLFLAFNTSTAFSPTDTLILSRQAKALMMVQAGVSLAVLSFLIARGVNTLGS